MPVAQSRLTGQQQLQATLVAVLERFGRIPALHPPEVEASPDSAPCASCSHQAPRQTLRNVNGDMLCTHCCWECQTCAEPHWDTQVWKAFKEDGSFVFSCRRGMGQCGDCGEYYLAAFVTNQIHGRDLGPTRPRPLARIVCNACFALYVNCEECETGMRRRNMQCSSCGNDGKILRSHSYKPQPRFLKLEGETSKLFMGFELEADLGGHSEGHVIRIGFGSGDLRKQFYCKLDGSVPNGIEVVSHPGTIKFWMKHDLPWCSTMAKMGYRSYDTDNCGMHVHVGRSTLTSAMIAKLLLFMGANKPFMFYISRRKTAPLAHYSRLVDKGMRPKIAIRTALSGFDDGRYQSLNLQNRATIEFRLFRGTLRALAIKRNLAFVYSLVEFVRRCTVKQATSLDAFRAFISAEPFAREVGSNRVVASLIKWVNDFDVDFAEEE